MSIEKKTVRVGSRKSQLALIQTHRVIGWLKAHNPSINFEVVSMTTTGDNILDTALSKIGEKKLFTRELETALLQRDVDFVVHSLKDLPTELPEGLVIGAVCRRDDPHDAVVLSKKNSFKNLESLTDGSVIGTSSLRRSAQLKRRFPHLQIADVRGNLNTRLRKLDDPEGVYDAIVLAVAGLHRMDWHDRISEVLSTDISMYAVGQGAMAVECRADDIDTLSLISQVTDRATLLQCIAERSFLRQLEGGCSVPVAVTTELKDFVLSLRGGVFSIDGKEAFIDSRDTVLSQYPDATEHDLWPKQHFAAITAPSTVVSTEDMTAAHTLGVSLATKLLADGAAEVLMITKRQMAEEVARQKAEKAAKRLASNLTEKQ